MVKNPDDPRISLLQPIGIGGDSILKEHLGTISYLLPPQAGGTERPSQPEYHNNEDVWRDVLREGIFANQEIILRDFEIIDWFPRAPGLYHTPGADNARYQAQYYVEPDLKRDRFANCDHSTTNSNSRPAYTAVYSPWGKQSMLEGGIGSIRLKPIRIDSHPYWLLTATSDGIAHAGFPIAVPLAIYRELVPLLRHQGYVSATMRGVLEFFPDPLSRVFDTLRRVPRLFLRLTGLERANRSPPPAAVSVAVSFVSDFEGPPKVYVTYVTFDPGKDGSFEDAVTWMKTVYVEGQYRGRIITDFDQTKTIFPEARLALSSVMDQLISRGAIRETIELMHARASADSYFSEMDRYNLLLRSRYGDRTKVFISYAHNPETETGWVRRIRTHLSSLIHAHDIEIWDDTRVQAGEHWRDEITGAISHSKVAVLVLTADFLSSKFIQEVELPLLLEAADADGATILCLYGSNVHLSGNAKRLERYQFVNKPTEPLQSLSEAAREAVYADLVRRVEDIFEVAGGVPTRRPRGLLSWLRKSSGR